MAIERTPDGIAWEAMGSGPPVLLMHEGIGDRSSWDGLLPEFAAEFTAIRFDHRGFGDSDDPPEGYSAVGDCLAVLDAAGAERAALIGVSMSGEVALDLALEHPERVEALLLVAATPSGWEPHQSLLDAYAEAEAHYERGDLDGVNEVEMQIWLDGIGRGEPVDQAVRARVAAVNRRLLDRQDEMPEPVGLDVPAMERLEELRAPALVVTGPHDQPSVLAGAAHVAEATGADTAEIAGAAHLPHLERPGEFASVALPFLRDHPAGA